MKEGKAFNLIQHLTMSKTLNKLSVEGNLNRSINKPAARIILSGETEYFPTKIRIQARMSTPTISNSSKVPEV